MLPFSQILMPESFGPATVGYSVTFPAFPYYPATITDTPAPQISSNSYAAEFFKKWKLEKRNALERQVCELVKKYGTVETDGKEVLGWFILLSPEDRAVIKECGNLSGFLKSNPCLLIVNNLVKLKDRSHLSFFASSIGGYCSSKYNQEITDYCDVCYPNMDHPESTDLPVMYSDGELYSHEDACVHFKVHSGEDHFCLGQACCLKPQESSRKISKQQYTRPTSMVFMQSAMPVEPDCLDKKIKHVSSPSDFVSTPDAKETVNQSQVEPHCSSAIQNFGDNQVIFSGRSSPSYLQSVNISHKYEETIYDAWDAFDYTQLAKDEPVSRSSETCLDFEKPSQNVSRWQKHLIKSDQLIDQECSASDICDDETFLSVKSGSYSRSSSTVSVVDTDTESCLFEEALEDLSSSYLGNQKNYSHGLLCTSTNTDQWSADTPLDVKESLSKSGNHKINSNEITVKQHRNMSCNTDFSWLIPCRSDKETQTEQVGRQETGVNTDQTFGDIINQDAENAGSGDYREYIEDYNGNKHFSSISHEALKQRAVKAELQLLDVQRLICWQQCWEAQQQCMEQQSAACMHTASGDHSQDVVGFNLLSALAEVEEKYVEIKKQIQSGVPLDSLVPLSMQLTKLKPPPNNPNKSFMETCQLALPNGSADHKNLQKIKAVGNNQETTCLSRSEDLQKESSDHEKLLPEQKKYYVLLGNIAPLVKEVDLKTAFEKFKVSSIFLEESSLTSSYAFLVFNGSEEALAAVKEMDGKMFFGKNLKARVAKTFQNFQFDKIFSATVPEQKAISGPQRFSFQSQAECVGTFSKPTPPNEIQSGSYWENVKTISSNMPHSVSFPGGNQTFPSATYTGSALFGYMPHFSQWPWNSAHLNRVSCNSIPSSTPLHYHYPKYTFPGTYPLSFHTPMNSMCKPSVNVFSNSVDFGLPPPTTARISVHNNTRSFNSSTIMLNRGTSAENNLPRKSVVQKVIEPASVRTISSVNKHASLDLANTTATSAVSSTLPIAVTAACKIPVVSESLLAHENKTVDTSEKTSFKPAAPLRFPMFVPESVTIPETNLLTQTSKSDLQQTESFPLDEEEWGVHPKLDPTSELPVYIVPNRLNLSQFNKVTNFLLKSHKNVTRDDVVAALEEIRIGEGGSLGGLTIPQIVRQASSKLEAKLATRRNL